jgi:hypothetical protein
MKRCLLCVLIVVAVSGLAMAPAAAGGGDTRVIPPVGNTYGEWGAKFFQWSYSMPVDSHPLFNTADISAGQRGPVWFIGGTFLSTEVSPGNYLGEAHRSGTIPRGTVLFFPLMNAEQSTLEGGGTKPKCLTACAEYLMSFVDPADLFCEIDGVPVADLGSYLALSRPSVYGPLPANSILESQGYPVGEGDTSLFVADGYYLMLRPLPVGEHTIHFGGFLDASADLGFTFTLDITYDITVVPK